MAKVIIPERICPHCGGNEWYVTINNKDNSVYRCAKRMKEYSKNRQTYHKEKIKETKRKYYQAHKEELKKKQSVYRHTYPEKINEEHRNYRAKHRKQVKGYQKKYRDSHKEKEKEYKNLNREKRKPSELKYNRRKRNSLSDSYVKECIRQAIYSGTNVKIDRKSITNEEIEMYRESILIQRKLKQLRNIQKIEL